MNYRGLDELHPGRNVPALPEVGVLVYGAGDEARDFGDFFGVVAEDEGEAGCEGSGGLHGREGEFCDVVAAKGVNFTHEKLPSWNHLRIIEAKRALDLVVCGSLA